jgi:hypothetical protein
MADGSLAQAVIERLLHEEHRKIEDLKQTQQHLLREATHARIELYRELLSVLDGQARLQGTRLEKAEMRSQKDPAAAQSLQGLMATWQEHVEAIQTIQDMLKQTIALLQES